MRILLQALVVLADSVAPQTANSAFSLSFSEALASAIGLATVIVTAFGVYINKKSARSQYELDASRGALHTSQARQQQLQLDNRQLQDKLERLKDYARTTPRIEYVYQDIILLGPRNSGKTSTAELWTKPWVDTDSIAHSTDWTPYEASIFPLETVKRYDPTFEVERSYNRILRVRIHDYPGDDHFRQVAIQSLPQIESKAVLLLFLEVEADSRGCLPTSRNNNYYSKTFLESIESQKRITTKLEKVMVVFNKIDRLPADWNITRMRRELREVNADADSRINSLFSGILEYHFVSASTNQGLISLLGSAAATGLPDEARKRFKKHLDRLNERVTRGIDTDAPRPGAPAS